MKKLRINNAIRNKTVLKEINKFKNELKETDLTDIEQKLLIQQEFILNPKYRFIKIANNKWYDRFTKSYHQYTQPKSVANKTTDLRFLYLRLLKQKHINNLMLNKNLSKDEAENEYNTIVKKISLSQVIQTFGS